MAHLNLQTPPVSVGMHNMPQKAEDDGNLNQPFNPFCTRPTRKSRASRTTSRGRRLDRSTASGLFEQASTNGDGRSSQASEISETKAAAPRKARRPSKATSRSRERMVREIKTEAAKADNKSATPEEPHQGDEDDDDDGGDDDDEQPSAGTGGRVKRAKKLAEKRRKRRESHNAVERRRRDNINEKITELATLLPEAMLLDAIATSTQGGNSGTSRLLWPPRLPSQQRLLLSLTVMSWL